MQVNIGQRSAIALGLGGALCLGAAGALATSAHADPPARAHVAPAATASPTTAVTTASTRSVQSPAPGQLSVAQALGVASRRMHAKPVKVELRVGAAGVDYEVKLARPDGSDVEVLVVGRTGRVLTESQQEQMESEQTGSEHDTDRPDTDGDVG